MNGDRLIGVEEAAKRLSMSVWSLRQLVATGRLPAVRFAERGKLRFRPEDVEALIERSRQEVTAA